MTRTLKQLHSSFTEKKRKSMAVDEVTAPWCLMFTLHSLKQGVLKQSCKEELCVFLFI